MVAVPEERDRGVRCCASSTLGRRSAHHRRIGRSAGGIVHVTNSGSNDFHGWRFEFDRNDRFGARNCFATTGATPTPENRAFFEMRAGDEIRVGYMDATSSRGRSTAGRLAYALPARRGQLRRPQRAATTLVW